MTTLGEDIKDVLVDIGTEIKIFPQTGATISGEYIDYDVNIRTSNPFHREFFLETTFPYDSQAESGDIIEFTASETKYIVTTKTPVIFEDIVIENDNVVYKCNVSGELSRPAQIEDPDWPEHYINDFSSIKDPCYGLLTESNYDNEWRTSSDYGDYAIREMFLYLPAYIGIQTEDRYMPFSGEYYRVGIVRQRIFGNTDVAILHEDTRQE